MKQSQAAISSQDVREAYIKLKTSVYFDNSELIQRRQLADFEYNATSEGKSFPKFYSSIDDGDSISKPDMAARLNEISDAINSYDKNSEFFDIMFEDIRLFHLPKNFQPHTLPENYLTNKRNYDEHPVESTTVFLDLPIELHLISVLWLMKFGFRLDETLSSDAYGNRLVLDEKEDGIVFGRQLFLPYFSQYQRWRDRAVKAVERLIEDEQSVSVINLDVKDFFPSVEIEFSTLEDALEIDSSNNLHSIFRRIHEVHANLVSHPNKSSITDNKVPKTVSLPIGLQSSYVLANWYLSSLDHQIKESVRPIYYGRYVDDILLILSDSEATTTGITKRFDKFDFAKYRREQIEKGYSVSFDGSKLDVVEKYILSILYPIVCLIDQPKSKVDQIDEASRVFKIECANGCYFQTKKTTLYHFDAFESTAVIDRFKQDLIERSSEFRDFPDEDEISGTLNDQAYHLIYDDTEGKIRTLKDYKENRYGLSVFLAHRIQATIRRHHPSNEEDLEALLRLFHGINSLKHFRLWEKLFTYFLVNKDPERFSRLFEHIFEQIGRIISSKSVDSDHCRNLRHSLYRYLLISSEMALAINPVFFANHRSMSSFRKARMKLRAKYLAYDSRRHFRPGLFDRIRFRASNLLRHHFVYQPLVNYTNVSNINSLDLSAGSFPVSSSTVPKDLKINPHRRDYSPRRVKFWECCIFMASRRLYDSCFFGEKNINPDGTARTSCLEEVDEGDDNFYLKDAYRLYKDLNRIRTVPNFLEIDEYNPNNELFSLSQKPLSKNLIHSGIDLNLLEVDENIFVEKPRLALANVRLNQQDFLSSIRGEPRMSRNRFEVFEKLLNMVNAEKSDMFLLPECSVPHTWVASFAKYSMVNQVLIVAGLEHWLIGDVSFNFIVTIIPTEHEGVKDAVVVYRLKNHYAPSENQKVLGNGYVAPKLARPRYDLICWKGLYFAPYYCVELGNIYHRSLFKSMVDLIICSEWNADTPYFSNIIESLSRDLHVYAVQVNNSEYGDSRITQPKKTAEKDILKIKGGINSAILVGEIDIKRLREFQRQSFDLTHNIGEFKPLPPDFDRGKVLDRIKNILKL